MPDNTAAATRVFLRPLANPLSLGFLGLFFATVLFSGLELGWVPTSEAHILAAAVLILTVPVQLIACIYGFLARDMVAATGMGILAGIWGAVAVATLMSPPGGHSPALGLILVVGAVAVCMPAIAAAQAKVLAAGVILSTAVRWGVTSGFEWSGGSGWKVAAGAAGLFLAAVSLYASLAFELEDQHRRTVLPTLRRSSGATAMTGDLAAQVDKAANEAGVRKQL